MSTLTATPNTTIHFKVSPPGCASFQGSATFSTPSPGEIQALFSSSENPHFSGSAAASLESNDKLCSNSFSCDGQNYQVCLRPTGSLNWGEVEDRDDIQVLLQENN